MKVFYDSQIFLGKGYGGISRYFVELASKLAKYPDVDLRVVAPFFQSGFLSEQRSRISTIGLNLSGAPKLPARLLSPMNAALFCGYSAVTSPDVVHETFYDPKRTAPKSSRVVTTIHDTIPERLPQIWRTVERHRANRQKVLARADRVICVSESTRRDLLELYEVDPARVSVVLLAASILPSKEEPMDFGAPYFLHVGARYLYKNFNGLIAAFGEAQLHRTHKLVSFSAVPLTDAELTAMERAGVPKERVIRVGGDDNVLARYYAGAEALVFPSMYEGFGIPLLEAMRCSCPIITSNISSLPEVAGDAAIYCDPGDIKSIAEAMVKIASSPEARKNLIAKGIQRAQRFSWDCCAEETYAVYCDLLSHS
jgi:glycosyltransferase involved in cell wall biosynthesis